MTLTPFVFCVISVSLLSTAANSTWFRWNPSKPDYKTNYIAKYSPTEVHTPLGSWAIQDPTVCNEQSGEHCHELATAAQAAEVGSILADCLAGFALFCSIVCIFKVESARVPGGVAALLAGFVQLFTIFWFSENFPMRRACLPAKIKVDGQNALVHTCSYGQAMDCSWVAITCLGIASLFLCHAPKNISQAESTEQDTGGSSATGNLVSAGSVEQGDEEVVPVPELANVVVPQGVSPGQAINVTLPSGRVVKAVVPSGISAGSELQITVDAVPKPMPKRVRRPRPFMTGPSCAHGWIVAAIIVLMSIIFGARYPAVPYGSEGVCNSLPASCPVGNGFYSEPTPHYDDDDADWQKPCNLCGGKTCCTRSGMDEKTDFSTYLAGTSSNKNCKLLLQKLSCAPCSPQAASFTEDFNIGENASEPIHVCDSFCRSIWTECSDLALTDPVFEGKTLGMAFPKYSDNLCPDVFDTASTRNQAYAGRHCFSAGAVMSPSLTLTFGSLLFLSAALSFCRS